MVPASLAIAGLRVEPLTDGTDYEFVDEVVGGHIPRALIPAVDKGVQETMKGGVIAGFPLTGIRVACYDGSYHPVDLQRDAFRTAAALACRRLVPTRAPWCFDALSQSNITVNDSRELRWRRYGRCLGLRAAA